MNADLGDFLARLAGTVAMTLVPVVLIAFLSMTLSLGRPSRRTAARCRRAGRAHDLNSAMLPGGLRGRPSGSGCA